MSFDHTVKTHLLIIGTAWFNDALCCTGIVLVWDTLEKRHKCWIGQAPLQDEKLDSDWIVDNGAKLAVEPARMIIDAHGTVWDLDLFNEDQKVKYKVDAPPTPI